MSTALKPRITPLDLAVAVVHLLGGGSATYRCDSQMRAPVSITTGDGLLDIVDTPAGLVAKFYTSHPGDCSPEHTPITVPTDIGRMAIDESDIPTAMRTLAVFVAHHYGLR